MGRKAGHAGLRKIVSWWRRPNYRATRQATHGLQILANQLLPGVETKSLKRSAWDAVKGADPLHTTCCARCGGSKRPTEVVVADAAAMYEAIPLMLVASP